MSQENVELVRALFEAWNAGDMDAFRALYHPDAVLRMAADWPEPGPYFGREAMMREFERVRETWGGATGQNRSVTSSTLAIESLEGTPGVAQARVLKPPSS